MKKILSLLLIIAIFIGTQGAADLISERYTKDAIVTNISGDLITCRDFTGNDWQFYGSGIRPGQIVKLKMRRNHTESIYDDIIYDCE